MIERLPVESRGRPGTVSHLWVNSKEEGRMNSSPEEGLSEVRLCITRYLGRVLMVVCHPPASNDPVMKGVGPVRSPA